MRNVTYLAVPSGGGQIEPVVARATADFLTSRHLTNSAYVGMALPLEVNHSSARADAFTRALSDCGYSCAIFTSNERIPSGWIGDYRNGVKRGRAKRGPSIQMPRGTFHPPSAKTGFATISSFLGAVHPATPENPREVL